MSESTIDVEQLLAPISEEQPTGEELSLGDLDGPLMRLKDAFDEARKLIKEEQDKELSGGIDSQGQPWRSIPTPDWDTVIELSTNTLENRSKDFRVASWLTEALLRKHHLVGLRDGLELCWGLCERYWENIFPQPNEDDGHGVTVGAFAGLVTDATYPAILATPVVAGTKPNERNERSYTALDHMRAKDLQSLADSEERQQRLEQGQVEMAEFMSIAALTPSEFHLANLDVLDACVEKLNLLGEFFRENCRDDGYDEPTAPGVSGFREQLEALRRLIVELNGGASATEEEAEDIGNATGSGSGGSVSVSKEMTREQAFQAIEKIAQFFERTEPHTPVYFALRQAVRWGRMPLPDLLAELIDDHNMMSALRRQIGLPTPPEENQY
ncbi:MAG: type VI secretion system protein TssA [Pirellulaceae bacterium]